jgi:NAD(P)-dependent dehydrogenase (short-subunit alcohol dehydrogenase family)
MTSLEGKVAVITGGAGGLGQAAARALLAEGASVALVDVAPAVANVAAGLDATGDRVLGVQADASKLEDVERALEAVVARFGGIDIAVLNAGTWRQTRIDDPWEQAVADFDALIEPNLGSAFLFGRGCAQLLIERGGGDIVSIASADLLPSTAGDTNRVDTDLYNAAKWGINGLTDTWARALRPHGVRVNALCIGPTETPMLEAMRAAGAGAGQALDPAEVARLLVDLLKEGPGGRTNHNIGAWPGRPVELGPVRPPHRTVLYAD